jgi:hypothetical protein
MKIYRRNTEVPMMPCKVQHLKVPTGRIRRAPGLRRELRRGTALDRRRRDSRIRRRDAAESDRAGATQRRTFREVKTRQPANSRRKRKRTVKDGRSRLDARDGCMSSRKPAHSAATAPATVRNRTEARRRTRSARRRRRFVISISSSPFDPFGRVNSTEKKTSPGQVVTFDGVAGVAGHARRLDSSVRRAEHTSGSRRDFRSGIRFEVDTSFSRRRSTTRRRRRRARL